MLIHRPRTAAPGADSGQTNRGHAAKMAHPSSPDDEQAHDGLTPISTKFYHNSRRFPVWGSKGNAVRGNFPNAAAAPETVSGESFVRCNWESRSWEGDERKRPASQETCRQPWSHAKMSVGEYRH